MGWLSVLLSVSSAFSMYKKAHIILMTVAIIVSIGCFWSWGVMHNFATEAAKRRRGYKGGFYDFAEKDVQTVPNWITRINMGFSLLGLILFICGILIEKV